MPKSSKTAKRLDRLVAICKRTGCEFRLDEPLSSHTSFGVGGPADLFVEPNLLSQIAAINRFCTAECVPFFLMGNGTNLIINDKGFRGVVARLTKLVPETDASHDNGFAPAGKTLRALVNSSIRRGLAGLEPFVDIPGSVGGALFMNAGAFGRNIWEMVETVWLLGTDSMLTRFSAADFPASYRTGGVMPGEVILAARFRLSPEGPKSVAQRAREYRRERAGCQPLSPKSAGCIFRNPPGKTAGSLIDEAGMKGKCLGGAEVSPVHANFIVNRNGAQARHILQLIDDVRSAVLAAFGVQLELEVQVLGEYGLVEL